MSKAVLYRIKPIMAGKCDYRKKKNWQQKQGKYTVIAHCDNKRRTINNKQVEDSTQNKVLRLKLVTLSSVMT